MTFALHSTELFARPATISPYSPEQQRELLYYNRSISAESLIDRLVGLRFIDKTVMISVPYLQSFIDYNRPTGMPGEEAFEAFTQTDEARHAAQETLNRFAALQWHYMNKRAGAGLLTFGQASAILHTSRDKLQTLVDMADITLQTAPHQGLREAQQFAAADLERLYAWHYPPGFPIELLDQETPGKIVTTGPLPPSDV